MESLKTEQKIKSFLRLVAQKNASDLHLTVGRYPTIRVSGKLVPLSEESMLEKEDTQAFANVLLTRQNKDFLDKTGSVDFSYTFEKKARFRVNVFVQQESISIVARFIPNEIKTLEELHLSESLYTFANYSQGLFLVTGPVGHGKSTTLAALVDYINHSTDRHILTIEDPIEYVYEQDKCIISQREVGRDTPTFEAGLKAAFREDTNVILIGEMRDMETISTAITAAETGHLILATLHTNNAAQTIDRIIDVFPPHQQNQIRFQLANVLLGVVSQRLIMKVGGGRIPAAEIMVKNDAVENLIRENKSFQIDTAIETGIRDGMIPLEKSIRNLLREGQIEEKEALRYVSNREYFLSLQD